MNKTIFITGISGSGKTTTSKHFSKLGYKVIHLDEISKYYQRGKPIKNPIVKHFVMDINKYNRYPAPWEKDDYMVINSFIKFITQLDGKYVIEGIHIMMPYIDRDYLMDYNIYIMSTSSMESMMRRVKRGIKNDVSLKSKIRNIIKYDLNPMWIIDDIIFHNFKREMKRRNKKLVTL